MMTTTPEDGLWIDARAATRRLDRVPLRTLVSSRLGRSGHATTVEFAMDRWNTFLESIGDDREPQLERQGQSVEEHWRRRAGDAIDAILDPLRADVPNDDVLLVLAFVYFECNVIWEHSADYPPSEALLTGAAVRALEAAGRSGVRPEIRDLLLAVASASTSLRLQFEVEQAWLCGCPISTEAAATAAEAELRIAASALGDAARHLNDDGADPATFHLHAILTELVNDALTYCGLLAHHVAPAARSFVANLTTRDDDRTVRAELRAARDAIEAALNRGSGAPWQLVGVSRSEARAQARAVAGMLEVVDAAHAVPTLLVQSAELQFVYPFRLPDHGTDGPIHSTLIDAFRDGGRTLAGCSVTIDGLFRSESVSRAAEMTGTDPSTTPDARLVIADHQLVLETNAGERYAGFGVEVMLRRMGNHLVRVTASTDMPRTVRDPHGGEWCAQPASGWTPHDLDQFLHRGGQDFGAERLAFLTRKDALAGAAFDEDLPQWGCIMDLVVHIVRELHDAIPTPAGSDPDGPDAPVEQAPADDIERQVRQQGHILMSVSEVSAVRGANVTAVHSVAGLEGVAGADLLFSNQPPLPRALEEWTCAPAISGVDRGLAGPMDSYAMCNGDTTLLFVPFSPNWQVIEDKELVLFALSLGSAYISSRQQLIRTMSSVTALDTPEELALEDRKELERRSIRVQHVEAELNRRTAFADQLIDHARSAVVIRPRRDRALLDHVIERSGVISLHDDLAATRRIANDRATELREVSGKVRDARRRRGEVLVERLLTALAVFAFIDLFWWFFDMHKEGTSEGWTDYFWVSTGLLIAVALVLTTVVLGQSRQRGATPGREPEPLNQSR